MARNPCARHDHPRLSTPVSHEQVEGELRALCQAAGIHEGEVRWPKFMDQRHEKERRSYAQVRPGRRAHTLFEFAQAVRWLPDEHRLGLLAHEVGHVLAEPSPSEDEADQAARRALGIRIEYDRRWPEKGLQRASRENRAECPSGVPAFADGFCPPRGELADQPSDDWTRGCRHEVVLALGQELGDLSVARITEEQGCSAASVRKVLAELEDIGAVKRVSSGKPHLGRGKPEQLYRVTDKGLDLSEWLSYRESAQAVEAVEASLGAPDVSFDPAALEAEDRPDPWKWSWVRGRRKQLDLGELEFESSYPSESDFAPATIKAWSSRYPEHPVGELEFWATGLASQDPRRYGRVGAEGYAPISRLRVHPAFRRSGVATALVHEAARQAAARYEVPLASPDERTPSEAAWWTRQERKGRAKKVRHRSDAHPDASRYMLGYPPPRTLENVPPLYGMLSTQGWRILHGPREPHGRHWRAIGWEFGYEHPSGLVIRDYGRRKPERYHLVTPEGELLHVTSDFPEAVRVTEEASTPALVNPRRNLHEPARGLGSRDKDWKGLSLWEWELLEKANPYELRALHAHQL